MRHLVGLGPDQIKAELKELRAAWLELVEVKAIIDRAHPQVASVVNRFALVAAALHMAVKAGILPWTDVDIDVGIIACMQRWVRQRGNVDTAAEMQREIERRWQMIAATLDYRFIHVRVEDRRLVPGSDADSRKIEAAHNGEQFDGYIKGEYVLITPEAWRRLWAGLDADVVKKHLQQTGLLIADPTNSLSLQKFESGAKPARFYVLAKAMLTQT